MVAISLFLMAAASPSNLVNPCLDATQPYAKMPFCNASLSVEARAKDAVGRMDLKTEKIPNLNTNAPAIKSLGIPGYNWWEEASSGVSNGHQTTKFAYPITTGMSFNRTLWQLTGRLRRGPSGIVPLQSHLYGESLNLWLQEMPVTNNSAPSYIHAGRQIAHEARALMNAGSAGSTYWAPVINLAREPRWGRNIEVPK
jgi:pre-mRNA-splicing factor SYF2/beta-D-xylosidase 4